jgi:hypothetical protein
LRIFRKSVKKEKIQVSLKSDINNGTLQEDLSTFMIISSSILLRVRNVSDKFPEKIKIHNLYSITFFFENRAVHEIVEKYSRPIVRQATDDNIIRHIRMACWISKATETHNM